MRVNPLCILVSALRSNSRFDDQTVLEGLSTDITKLT